MVSRKCSKIFSGVPDITIYLREGKKQLVSHRQNSWSRNSCVLVRRPRLTGARVQIPALTRISGTKPLTIFFGFPTVKWEQQHSPPYPGSTRWHKYASVTPPWLHRSQPSCTGANLRKGSRKCFSTENKYLGNNSCSQSLKSPNRLSVSMKWELVCTNVRARKQLPAASLRMWRPIMKQRTVSSNLCNASDSWRKFFKWITLGLYHFLEYI